MARKKVTKKSTVKKISAKKASRKKRVKKKAIRKTSPVNGRPYKYRKYATDICVGQNAITVQRAKEILGWEVTDEKDYLLKDRLGNKIICTNNTTNRPLVPVLVETYCQEHLMKRWQVNGENIIIGETGLVLEGQHTLIGLVLAAQDRQRNPEKWQDYWSDDPVLEKFVAYGISERDEVVNTINTGKPRSLSDVIFRSEMFADMPKGERNRISKITESAVKLLWHRTGAKQNAFAPIRTHMESLDFIYRHKGLLDAVHHIHRIDEHRDVSKFVSAGYASALLYLMGASESDADEYYRSDRPEEGCIDWGNWDNACSFWEKFKTEDGAPLDDDIKVLREELGAIMDDTGGSLRERCALIAKAWLVWFDKGGIDPSDLALEYSTDDDGIKHLSECPIVGGIDIGSPEGRDPSPQEIEDLKLEERRRRRSKTKPDRSDLRIKDEIWVNDPHGEHYQGQLLDVREVEDGDDIARVRIIDGSIEEVPFDRVQRNEP